MELFALPIVGKMNPLNYVAQGSYVELWQYLFRTILHGFWARTIAALSLVFAFWFGAYRRRVGLGITFFIICLIMAYGSGIFRALFYLK
ncbi:MAG TPA: hypothetical protein PLN56_10715 [Methanoregulaceae archaeon]|nr:hypothetical protein [Methanoregulaceae archaeon]